MECGKNEWIIHCISFYFIRPQSIKYKIGWVHIASALLSVISQWKTAWATIDNDILCNQVFSVENCIILNGKWIKMDERKKKMYIKV